MTAAAKRRTAARALVSLNLLALACSTDSTPQKGTPAFYWSAANEAFAVGDYGKTIDHLDKLVSADNEYTAKALPWYLIMNAGLSRGYMNLADSYETGARINKSDPSSFRRHMSTYRGAARRYSLSFADNFGRFQNSKSETIPLAFGSPTGSPAPIPALTKVSNGMLPAMSEMEEAQKRAVERAVLLEICRASGAPDDLAKTREILKGGNAQVPRAVFVTAAANWLFDQSQLFTPMKLDDPEKMKIFCDRARDALKTVPATQQTKELNVKIDSALKRVKRS